MLTVPETAVTAFAGTPRVFVAKDGKAVERVIETAGKMRDRVLVAKGVTEGEQVVTTGVELLTDGKAITIRERKQNAGFGNGEIEDRSNSFATVIS